ncbi:MAG: hypothetical protein ACI9J2_000828 [Saprospiraceae bacterium]|jgi:uncharacterized protein (TIGR02647 family)
MISHSQIEELKLLSQFSIDSTQTGIKVHTNEAPETTVAAAQRLFDKGLTDQVDGGYLTERGVEAAVHAQGLMNLLAD